MDRTQSSQFTKGALLILLGVILLGDQLGLVWGWSLGRLWPLVLIVLGVGRWLQTDDDGRLGRGLWLVFLGGLFLMHTHDVMSLRLSWPLFIVAGGVSLIVGCRDGRAARPTGGRP